MPYDLRKQLKLTADSFAMAAAFILTIAVALSFLARFHWFADIFSHFLIQYIIGAVLLGLYYSIFRNKLMVACMVLIFTLSIGEIGFLRSYRNYTQQDPQISVMQYNRLIYQTKHDDLRAFLEENKPDIVVLQEAGAGYNKLIDDLSSLYPHHINETRVHAFGMVVLSHYHILRHEIIPLKGSIIDNFLIRAEIDIPEINEPLILYSLHTLPPVGQTEWRERNIELREASRRIKDDPRKYIITMGDWNITPYSPFFKDFLKETRLHLQNNNFYAPMTWPSSFGLPIFQVPIDHVIASSDLLPVNSFTGPAMNSDHLPLIAQFAYRQ